MSAFEPRPVLGFSEFFRGSTDGIPDGAHLTLFARRGSGFVNLDKLPGGTKPYGRAFEHKGRSGPEIGWDLPFRPAYEIREVVTRYVDANGFEGPPDQYSRLMQLLS